MVNNDHFRAPEGPQDSSATCGGLLSSLTLTSRGKSGISRHSKAQTTYHPCANHCFLGFIEVSWFCASLEGQMTTTLEVTDLAPV